MALLAEIYQHQLASIDKYYEDTKKSLLDLITLDPTDSQFLSLNAYPKTLKAEIIRRFSEDGIKATISFSPRNGKEGISITIPPKSEEFEDVKSDKLSFLDTIYERQSTSIDNYYDRAKKELFEDIAQDPLGSTFRISVGWSKTLIPIIVKRFVADGINAVAHAGSFFDDGSINITVPSAPINPSTPTNPSTPKETTT
jgi:hypothetical protein